MRLQSRRGAAGTVRYDWLGGLLFLTGKKLMYRLLVEFVCLALDDLQGAGGAGTEAGSEAVAEFILKTAVTQ